jgi:hypothetical protein
MMILLETGPGFHRTVAELGSMGQAIIEACDEGLEKGGKVAAGRVVSDYLSGQALKRRTSNLARAVDSWPVAQLEVAVGVKPNTAVDDYAWQLTDEEKTIVPKKAKFLAIPIGEALTPSGVPRFSSPREVPEGFFVKSGGRLLFGRKRGKRGKFRPLFTLVKSVFVQGSGALYDGVDDSIDDVTGAMQDEVDKRITR